VAGARVDWASGGADAVKANTALYYAYNGTRETSYAEVLPSGHVRLLYQASGGVEISGGVGSTVRVAEPSELYYAVKRMGTTGSGIPASPRAATRGSTSRSRSAAPASTRA